MALAPARTPLRTCFLQDAEAFSKQPDFVDKLFDLYHETLRFVCLLDSNDLPEMEVDEWLKKWDEFLKRVKDAVHGKPIDATGILRIMREIIQTEGAVSDLDDVLLKGLDALRRDQWLHSDPDYRRGVLRGICTEWATTFSPLQLRRDGHTNTSLRKWMANFNDRLQHIWREESIQTPVPGSRIPFTPMDAAQLINHMMSSARDDDRLSRSSD